MIMIINIITYYNGDNDDAGDDDGGDGQLKFKKKKRPGTDHSRWRHLNPWPTAVAVIIPRGAFFLEIMFPFFVGYRYRY